MKPNAIFLLIALLLVGALTIWKWATANSADVQKVQKVINSPGGRRVVKTEVQWQELLTSPQYYVTREKGTEGRNSHPYTHLNDKGIYACVCCQNPLFSSAAKFESGTGWPSFYQPIVPNAIYTDFDGRRTEVLCSVCDAHLGHVFTDGPEPTGLRYCMNGTALRFTAKN